MQVIIRIAFLVAVSLCICYSLQAQRQNNIWYFGNGAGLDFNSGKPIPLKEGKLFTEEGCASVSNQSGKLLFYTNGVKVWDADHAVMDEGQSLAGGVSSTQSTIIVPTPGDKTKYYIFTADEKAGPKGLSYSIVDMTKRNGKGNVVKKNQFLFGPIVEKLTITPHFNGEDYWIIVHQWNTNAFASFQLTPSGLITAPILSKVGRVNKDYGTGNKGETIGQLKVSPNGKRIASVMCYIANNPIEIFEFDNATGEVTNQKEISTIGFAYGVEFSPNSDLLYVSFLKGSVGVIQYDLNAPNIFDSAYFLSEITNTSVYGSLQLGPDNKIYVSKTGRYLDVINTPNKIGNNCNYQISAVSLEERNCVYGLPAKVLSNDFKADPIITNDAESINNKSNNKFNKRYLCAEKIELDAGHEGSVFLWSTGETTQIINVRTIGSYTVKISEPDNVESKSINFMVNKGEPNVNIGRDTALFCIKKYSLNANNIGCEYKWSTGEDTQKIEITQSGKYSVTVTNGNCWDRDTIYASFDSKPPNFKALPSFSPENSGFNSKFHYTVNDVTEFYLEVKSSKGKSIWKTTNVDEQWNGRDKKGEVLEKGSYNWKVNYKGVCTFGETIEEEGTVRLY
jgi:hypothetical protein